MMQTQTMARLSHSENVQEDIFPLAPALNLHWLLMKCSTGNQTYKQHENVDGESWARSALYCQDNPQSLKPVGFSQPLRAQQHASFAAGSQHAPASVRCTFVQVVYAWSPSASPRRPFRVACTNCSLAASVSQLSSLGDVEV